MLKRTSVFALTLLLIFSIASCAATSEEDSASSEEEARDPEENIEEEPAEPGVPVLDVDSLIAAATDAPEFTGSCGDNLTWSFKDGVLAICGTGEMAAFDDGVRPWETFIGRVNTVVFDEGCRSVSEKAFYKCTNLTALHLPDTLKTLGNFAFAGCGLTALHIPKNLEEDGSMLAKAFCGCPISLFELDAENANYLSIDGVLFSKTGSTLLCYPWGDERESYDIPDGTQIINSYAFFGCKSLKSVTVPSTVVQIANRGFYAAYALESVTIDDGLTMIGGYAFASCGALSYVRLPETCMYLNDYAFASCTSLKSVTIPGSVISVGSRCFTDSGVTEIICSGTLSGYPWGASIA